MFCLDDGAFRSATRLRRHAGTGCWQPWGFFSGVLFSSLVRKLHSNTAVPIVNLFTLRSRLWHGSLACGKYLQLNCTGLDGVVQKGVEGYADNWGPTGGPASGLMADCGQALLCPVS